MTSKKASADWARLSQIFYELNNPRHPLHYALVSKETIANAVRSGDVPVRGRRDVESYAADFVILNPGCYLAFDRVEKRMTPDAEISVYVDTVTVKLPPPGGAGGAAVVQGMWQGGLSLPRIASPAWPKRVKYVDVEADRRAVEAWIRENALPAGVAEGSALEASKKGGGRPRTYDPATVEAEVIRLMDERGEFDTRDEEWNCLARLEAELMRFCEAEFGKEPARSTLQAPISNGLATWRGVLPIICR